jgi:7-cyano-7-deazaguanine reductase
MRAIGRLGLVTDADATDGLTILGATVRHPVDHLETFPAPAGCTRVRFSCEEVTSMCPVTEQPDLSTVVIEYAPDQRCIESKSLKLYLWSFRDAAVFAEQLAVDIATEVHRTAAPSWVEVHVTQRARGGIVTETFARLP